MCSACTQDPSTGEVKPTDGEADLDGVTSKDNPAMVVSENMAGDVQMKEVAESEAVDERGQSISV